MDFEDFETQCCPITSPLLATIERLFTGVGPSVEDIIDQCNQAGVDPSDIPVPPARPSAPSQPITLPTLPSVAGGGAGGSVDCSNPATMFQPDPAACTNFYMCSNGRGVKRACPALLYWNQAEELCDWPRNVACPARK